ncbi:MAG: L-arabinose isomerase [Oscillospiraceae bacterium]|jgi:L-arabinose isomerase|nr:L-arabinose isomerase [Oscillospiraceae bacterium]
MNGNRGPVFHFLTGSQHLYGEEALRQVETHSREIANYLSARLPFKLLFVPVVKTHGEILDACRRAQADSCCAGVITWMHTFSPSKMWIGGLKALSLPVLHLHTQYNAEIPFDGIDMDFMNINQSAHGDREHGYIFARMGKARKIAVGHYKDDALAAKIASWMRVAAAALFAKELKVMRLGDNMRDVAVTEGDKVEAQIRFGWQVNYRAVGELAEHVSAVGEAEVAGLMGEYADKYIMNTQDTAAVRYQAKLELGLKTLLDAHGCGAFTNTFEDLHGLEQLPGLASQRLMEQGYGFGPEGDWKVSALLATIKHLTANKGTTLMEDYTYHLSPGHEAILGAHMLEVCPTIAEHKPKIEVHPLGIGGKNPPARLVFNGKPGKAVCVSLVDMGGRLRLIVLDVQAIEIPFAMPRLPVARVMWKPEPDFFIGCEAWLLAGGAHHTVLSYDTNAEEMADLAEIIGIECVHIGKGTDIAALGRELRMGNLLWAGR